MLRRRRIGNRCPTSKIHSAIRWWAPVRTSRFRSEVINLGKRSRTRGLLMDAAVTVFAKRGIEATSISEVTATAGVSHGIFYYHFKSKAELLDAVGHAIAAALVNEVDHAISDVHTGVERVALATHEFIRRAAGEPEWGWLIVEALGDLGAFHDQISRGIRKDVAIGIAQGGFNCRTERLAVREPAFGRECRPTRAPAASQSARRRGPGCAVCSPHAWRSCGRGVKADKACAGTPCTSAAAGTSAPTTAAETAVQVSGATLTDDDHSAKSTEGALSISTGSCRTRKQFFLFEPS